MINQNIKKIVVILFLFFFSCFHTAYQIFREKYPETVLYNLLGLAKQAILDQMNHPTIKYFQDIEYTDQQLGVFIRLIKKGKERGCIGFLKGVGSLETAVKFAAVNAAFFDLRFLPLQQNELNQLEIEITIIGQFAALNHYDDFTLGRDSLLIDNYSFRGFLQAQIAVEEKYSKKAFLRALCRKAGLDEQAYLSAPLFRAYTVSYKKRFIP